ncbi:MAG: hypothetical protein EF813_06090 [Methanosarcinales archaeon]|nr:MAG: hypothetical protein EF813_06090 [Methanosarcinales archaeon]
MTEHVEPVKVQMHLSELDLTGIDKIAEDAVDFVNNGQMNVKQASSWAIHHLEDPWGFPSLNTLYHNMVDRLANNFEAKRELVTYIQRW